MMVRKYTPADHEQCLKLWHCFDKTHLEGDPRFFRQPTKIEIESRHNRYASEENKLIVVCDEGSLLSGFIAGEFRTIPERNLIKERGIFDIHALSVLPEYQDRKRAVSLFAFIFDLAKERGVSDVEGSIWSFNHKAAAFVEKIGFRVRSSKYIHHVGSE